MKPEFSKGTSERTVAQVLVYERNKRMSTPGVTVGEASKWATKLDGDLKLILQHLDLDEYEDVFERERITSLRRASKLSKQDLCELGMRIGERSVFMSEISRRTPGHSRHNSRNSFALSDLAILEEQAEGETQTGHEVLYLQPQSTACSLQDVPLSPRRLWDTGNSWVGIGIAVDTSDWLGDTV